MPDGWIEKVKLMLWVQALVLYNLIKRGGQMAEINRQRIKSIYSEIEGYLNAFSDKEQIIPKQVGRNYNQLLSELTELTQTDFERHAVRMTGNYYLISDARMSMSSVASRLKSDYSFSEQNSSHSNPIVINVNQNQQMTVSVTTIQELIELQPDDEVKELLKELSDAIDSKNADKSKTLLSTIGDKSWELFIKVLPYFLEKWAS